MINHYKTIGIIIALSSINFTTLVSIKPRAREKATNQKLQAIETKLKNFFGRPLVTINPNDIKDTKKLIRSLHQLGQHKIAGEYSRKLMKLKKDMQRTNQEQSEEMNIVIETVIEEYATLEHTSDVDAAVATCVPEEQTEEAAEIVADETIIEEHEENSVVIPHETTEVIAPQIKPTDPLLQEVEAAFAAMDTALKTALATQSALMTDIENKVNPTHGKNKHALEKTLQQMLVARKKLAQLLPVIYAHKKERLSQELLALQKEVTEHLDIINLTERALQSLNCALHNTDRTYVTTHMDIAFQYITRALSLHNTTSTPHRAPMIVENTLYATYQVVSALVTLLQNHTA